MYTRINTALPIQVWNVRFPKQSSWEERLKKTSAQASAVAYAPEPSLFFRLFPFHILLDQDMKIIQASAEYSDDASAEYSDDRCREIDVRYGSSH